MLIVDLTPPQDEKRWNKDILLDLFFQGYVFTSHKCPEGPIVPFSILDVGVGQVIYFRPHSFDPGVFFKVWIKSCPKTTHGRGYYCLTCGNRRYIPELIDRSIATALGGTEFWKVLKKCFNT